MMKSLLVISIVICTAVATRYSPTWESLDSRPLPTWYDEAKFGIFLHWGVFSVPSYRSAWFWKFWTDREADITKFMKKNYPPNFTYADFASQFTAEFYNPDEWADIFEAAGAQYVVLTAKHHEGYCNWPSKVSWNWNSMDVGPHKDLVGMLADAVRSRTKLHFGLYHSLFEFYNPLYLEDEANGYNTSRFVDEKTLPELYELINRYKPEVLWSDGDWMAPDVYWKAREFLAWLYNESPVKDTIVTNDRWGSNRIRCHHGGYYTCKDRYNPGHVLAHKWENCFTIDSHTWTYNRNTTALYYLSTKQLVTELITTVACGGNLLLNTGPTPDGRIAPIMEQRLREIGDWLKVNGEAIYKTRPWRVQHDNITADVWFTESPTNRRVNALMLSWPRDFRLQLGSVSFNNELSVRMLGVDQSLRVIGAEYGCIVELPVLGPSQMPSQIAWVLTIEGAT